METRIVALIPAHNEEETIGKTIQSLLTQTYPLTRIIVIPNNCNDNTADVARCYGKKYPQVHVLELHKISGKKAGALNRALLTLNPQDWDFVLQMDGDTFLDSRLVEEALKEFRDDPELGGVCSRCLVQPLDLARKYTFQNRLLWRLQNIEYSLGDSRNVERRGNVKVLAGAVTIYKMEALQQVAKLRSKGSFQVWKEEDLVEDYVLTLDVRSLGYQARAGMGMFAYTDVPQTFRDLQRQRDRWYSGTLIHLYERRWTSATKSDIKGQGLRLLGILVQLLYCVVMVYVLLVTNPTQLRPHPVAYLVVAVAIADYSKRVRYLRNPDLIQYLIVLTLLPWQLYALFDDYLVVRSYVLSLRRHRRW